MCVCVCVIMMTNRRKKTDRHHLLFTPSALLANIHVRVLYGKFAVNRKKDLNGGNYRQ